MDPEREDLPWQRKPDADADRPVAAAWASRTDPDFDPAAVTQDDDAPDPYAPPPQRTGLVPGWLATLLVAIAAIAGATFAATSTHDFARHLDGQVHSVTCSVLPGGEPSLGSTGCKAAMLSPYSSIWRDKIWGGVPVALGGFAVFAFLAAIALYLTWLPDRSKRESGWLLLATLLPVGTSGVFAWISANEVGTFCTVCVGIYGASAAAFLFALVALVRAPAGSGSLPWGRWAIWTLEGVLFVGALGWAWMQWAPSERASLKGCGTLVAEDAAGVLLQLPREPNAAPALMVLDPLCPACKAFETRLGQTGLDRRLGRDVLLFPLDSRCNWMVKNSLHPGACAVSEAMLCAPAAATTVLDWAFREQARLLELGKQDEGLLRKEIAERFPAVAKCLGGAEVKAKVNKALRFAVANALPVMTPQLYVGGTRLCDEDTDLGLEFALRRLISEANR